MSCQRLRIRLQSYENSVEYANSFQQKTDFSNNIKLQDNTLNSNQDNTLNSNQDNTLNSNQNNQEQPEYFYKL